MMLTEAIRKIADDAGTAVVMSKGVCFSKALSGTQGMACEEEDEGGLLSLLLPGRLLI